VPYKLQPAMMMKYLNSSLNLYTNPGVVTVARRQNPSIILACQCSLATVIIF
jgi:hypothetical protein